MARVMELWTSWKAELKNCRVEYSANKRLEKFSCFSCNYSRLINPSNRWFFVNVHPGREGNEHLNLCFPFSFLLSRTCYKVQQLSPANKGGDKRREKKGGARKLWRNRRGKETVIKGRRRETKPYVDTVQQLSVADTRFSWRRFIRK